MSFLTLFVLFVSAGSLLASGRAKSFGPKDEKRIALDGQQFIEQRQGGQRIIGGRTAEEGEIPYILSMKWHGWHFCGASYLQESKTKRDFAITAAHCVSGVDVEDLTLTAGSLTLSGKDGNQQVLGIRKAVVHPNYHQSDAGTPVNDIAVLILSGEFRQNEHVRPISIPSFVDDGEQVVISGWGATGESPSPDHLQVAKVTIVGNENCSSMYESALGNTRVIFNSTVCAGEINGGRDTCQGDSGGPLATINRNTKEHLLAGITSWGIGCARPNLPGVYTRLSSYTTWVINTVRENIN